MFTQNKVEEMIRRKLSPTPRQRQKARLDKINIEMPFKLVLGLFCTRALCLTSVSTHLESLGPLTKKRDSEFES